MSLTGSGRFRSIYDADFDDRHSSFSSSGRSGSFRPTLAPSGTAVSYEPGSGAEYMYSRGWHNRDAYGKPLPGSSVGAKTNVKFAASALGYSEKNDDLFARENRSKLILVILLAIVSLLLIAVVVVIVVLFVTGVFTTKSVPVEPLTIYPTFPPITQRPGYDWIVNRSFNVQLFIVNQANDAFADTNSFEYQRTFAMLQQALTSMFQQSAFFGGMQPSVGMQSIRNNQSDVQVNFRFSITVPSKSGIDAKTVENTIRSQLLLLENQLNGSEIDRGRISVSMDAPVFQQRRY